MDRAVKGASGELACIRDAVLPEVDQLAVY
jgi:hypothetical protein